MTGHQVNPSNNFPSLEQYSRSKSGEVLTLFSTVNPSSTSFPVRERTCSSEPKAVPAPTSSSLIFQMELESAPKDGMPSEIRMQSTAEPGRHGKSKIPLDVRFENLQALFNSVVALSILNSARSHESSGRISVHSLKDSRFELQMWSRNLEFIMPEANPSLDGLRILGKLRGPVAATLLDILGKIEKDLRELLVCIADNEMVFDEQFRAICDRIKASVDRLFEIQIALVEELKTPTIDVRNIIAEEKDPANHRLPVVCFDGGGVRSYSTLLILEALMGEICSVVKESEGDAIADSIRPRDVFRYIFGSSSGGLVAIMLGRLNMTVDQCKDTFRTYTDTIFRRHRRLYRLSAGLTTSKYSTKSLVQATESVIESFAPYTENDHVGRGVFAAPPGHCNCGVFASAESPGVDVPVPYLFRTYKNTSSGARNPGKADHCLIWQAALATAAAPSLFPTAKFDGKIYSDGGFMLNNPTGEAFRELTHLHSRNPVCLVSIGSGKRKPVGKIPFLWLGRHYNFLRSAIRSVTDTEDVHQLMSKFAAFEPGKLSYFRFNVPGLEDVSFDEWTAKSRKQWPEAGKMNTIDFIELETAQYLVTYETRTLLRICAQTVVDSYCPFHESTGPNSRLIGMSQPISD